MGHSVDRQHDAIRPLLHGYRDLDALSRLVAPADETVRSLLADVANYLVRQRQVEAKRPRFRVDLARDVQNLEIADRFELDVFCFQNGAYSGMIFYGSIDRRHVFIECTAFDKQFGMIREQCERFAGGDALPAGNS